MGKEFYGICDLRSGGETIFNRMTMPWKNPDRDLTWDSRGFTIASNNIKNTGIKFKDFKIAEKLAEILPFTLTDAQKRVIREIAKDIKDAKQLNRLVQGDVGSGKTMVALCSVLMAVNSGYQGAIMAPTEILATQHFEEMEKYFNHFGFKVALLTGSTKKKEKEIILKNLKEGNINVLIGTHAIIEKDVEFKNLALCVTDEQHRFGVNQRGKLYEKGENASSVGVIVRKGEKAAFIR